MVEVNDIVQITDVNDGWYPCILIVTEVKKWGIQGYLKAPMSEGFLFYRVENGKFEKVGTAVIVKENE